MKLSRKTGRWSMINLGRYVNLNAFSHMTIWGKRTTPYHTIMLSMTSLSFCLGFISVPVTGMSFLQVFFLDHNTKTTTFIDPRLPVDQPLLNQGTVMPLARGRYREDGDEAVPTGNHNFLQRLQALPNRPATRWWICERKTDMEFAIAVSATWWRFLRNVYSLSKQRIGVSSLHWRTCLSWTFLRASHSCSDRKSSNMKTLKKLKRVIGVSDKIPDWGTPQHEYS